MRTTLYRFLSFIFVMCLSLAVASTASAQKKKKQAQLDAEDAAGAKAVSKEMTDKMSDQEKIDFAISEMLGAWQIGDVEKLHKNIADDIVVVNGSWAPPVVGWNSYLAGYNLQRSRVQQIRLDRINTLIRVNGTTASVCYQWEFSGVVDGQQSGSRGQTTLLLEKRADKWMIIHNHTSVVDNAIPLTAGAVAPNPQPAAAVKP
ncbi:MAG TPA: nuclear transport factor 2 family protein [Candidatus Acidoferrum sp.]